jgi:ubiquitin carboxyl-terminal hydrolase 10
MFMREFKTIDSAESADKLRMRLKDQELEQYGDSITPEYVYDTIKQLPRFSSMRRGHQQDAEEFLGFLLDGIHDECMTVMRKAGVDSDDSAQPASPGSTASGANTDAGWLEVGPKQKQSVTRQSGESLSTPITRVFGGSLRSELRVPGLKNSVTMEPYQPLQLDIGAPDVNNIIQALNLDWGLWLASWTWYHCCQAGLHREPTSGLDSSSEALPVRQHWRYSEDLEEGRLPA